ncbi:MAG: hypothetical protein IKG82_16360 [Oscillospiraceae bacterium]|nr:hypothetical protein [Oscillospiraceae bacterium]
MNQTLRTAIYDKYIAPTKQKRPDYIGVEIEMPVVNLADAPVDEAVPIAAAEQFAGVSGFRSPDAAQTAALPPRGMKLRAILSELCSTTLFCSVLSIVSDIIFSDVVA